MSNNLMYNILAATMLPIIGLLVSCSTQDEISDSNALDLNVDLTNSQEIFPIEDFVDSYQLVELICDDNCVIGKINQLIVDDNYIYINDKEQSNQIYVFDENGRYSHRIGRKGRGPGEYVHPTDMIVVDSAIVVLDMYSHKLLYYDLNGNHIKDIKYNNKYFEIESDGENFFAYSGDNRDNPLIKDRELLLLNSMGDVKSAYFYNKNRLNYTNGQNIKEIDGRIYMTRALLPYICEFDDSLGLYKKYRINITPNPLPIDFEKQCGGDYENFINEFRNNYSYYSGNFWETNIYVGFTTEFQGRTYLSVYNKLSKKLITGVIGLSSNKTYSTDLQLLTIGIKNNTFVSNDTLYCVINQREQSLVNPFLSTDANPKIAIINLK